MANSIDYEARINHNHPLSKSVSDMPAQLTGANGKVASPLRTTGNP